MALVQTLLTIGFFGLNGLAVYKIITKAGYSGKWMMLVVAPWVAILIGFVVFITDVRSGDFHAGNFVPWYVAGALLFFVDYILFLVFAFSDWPALRQRRQSYPPGYGYGRPPYATPFGSGRGMRPPGAGGPLAPGRPSAGPAGRGQWPAGQGEWPPSQGGGWSDRSREAEAGP